MPQFEERPEEPEQLTAFDNLSFRLVLDGCWAAIKLNRADPSKGLSQQQVEANLNQAYPVEL